MANILRALRLRANTSDRIATIDAAKASPPPSPLQPVELTNEHQVAGVLLIGARVGDTIKVETQAGEIEYKVLEIQRSK